MLNLLSCLVEDGFSIIGGRVALVRMMILPRERGKEMESLQVNASLPLFTR